MKAYLLVVLATYSIGSYTLAKEGRFRSETSGNKGQLGKQNTKAKELLETIEIHGFAEEQVCYGPHVTTEDLHNHVIGNGPQRENYRNFANAAFRRYQLTVSAPKGWHFVGEPSVHFIGPAPGVSQKDAQSGFDWNRFDVAHDRFFVTSRTPNQIVATCWAGSHAMQINLACKAVKE